MKKPTYDVEAIRTPRTCCLIFFQLYRTEKFRSRDLLSQWSMKQTPVCIGGLGNIVLDEKSGSELEDKLEIVNGAKIRWDNYFFCVFTFLTSILEENVSGKLMLFTFFR